MGAPTTARHDAEIAEKDRSQTSVCARGMTSVNQVVLVGHDVAHSCVRAQGEIYRCFTRFKIATPRGPGGGGEGAAGWTVNPRTSLAIVVLGSSGHTGHLGTRITQTNLTTI